jgi:hypothetical protein
MKVDLRRIALRGAAVGLAVAMTSPPAFAWKLEDVWQRQVVELGLWGDVYDGSTPTVEQLLAKTKRKHSLSCYYSCANQERMLKEYLSSAHVGVSCNGVDYAGYLSLRGPADYKMTIVFDRSGHVININGACSRYRSSILFTISRMDLMPRVWWDK